MRPWPRTTTSWLYWAGFLVLEVGRWSDSLNDLTTFFACQISRWDVPWWLVHLRQSVTEGSRPANRGNRARRGRPPDPPVAGGTNNSCRRLHLCVDPSNSVYSRHLWRIFPQKLKTPCSVSDMNSIMKWDCKTEKSIAQNSWSMVLKLWKSAGGCGAAPDPSKTFK